MVKITASTRSTPINATSHAIMELIQLPRWTILQRELGPSVMLRTGGTKDGRGSTKGI